MLKFTDGELILIPGLVALFPALPIGVYIWSMTRDRAWRLMALLALAHISLVVALTIFPIPIGGQELYRRTRGMSEDNVVPFATIVSQVVNMSLSSIRQISGNLVALAPLGIYGPYLWPRLRGWPRFLLVAALFALGIETAQYVGSWLEGFTYRVTDVDDAIMNTTGAFVAFVVWPPIARRLSERFHWQDLSWPATTT